MSKTITVTEAAEKLGKSPQFVRIGLQQQRLPIGSAIQSKPGGRWCYHISPGLLKRYMEGV